MKKCRNFISTVARAEYHDRIGKISQQSENVSGSRKIFIRDIYLVKKLICSMNSYVGRIINRLSVSAIFSKHIYLVL